MKFLDDDLLPQPNAHNGELAHLQVVAGAYPETDVEALYLVMALARLSGTILTALDKHFARLGITQGRFAVLMHLSATPEGFATPTTLAEWCGVSRAAMTGLVDGLERDGLVERTVSPTDRRANIVQITERTREFLRGAVPQDQRYIADTTGQLTPQERKDLARLTARLLPLFDNLGQPESVAPQVAPEAPATQAPRESQ